MATTTATTRFAWDEVIKADKTDKGGWRSIRRHRGSDDTFVTALHSFS